MKRRSIFAALAAFFTGRAMGQEYTAGENLVLIETKQNGEQTKTLIHSVCAGKDGSIYRCPPTPTPNQCPVCGTMAEPYVRPTKALAYKSVPCVPPQPEGGLVPSVCIAPSSTARVGPMERITRCPRCSAAFWQDAEGEPK